MNVDILSVLTLAGSLITLIGAIWKIAEAKSILQQRVDRIETKLDRKIAALGNELEDKIKALENTIALQEQLKSSQEASFKIVLHQQINDLRGRCRYLKQDLYDVQSFLQSSQGFKLRFNSGTLNERPKEEDT